MVLWFCVYPDEEAGVFFISLANETMLGCKSYAVDLGSM